MAKKIRTRSRKRAFKRLINSYIIAQDDPIDNQKLRSLQLYLYQRGIGYIETKDLVKEIKKQQKKMKRNKRLRRIENELFKKGEEKKKYRYGSSFCPNCSMYKDYEKECPYCGKLELTR